MKIMTKINKYKICLRLKKWFRINFKYSFVLEYIDLWVNCLFKFLYKLEYKKYHIAEINTSIKSAYNLELILKMMVMVQNFLNMIIYYNLLRLIK